MSDLSSIPFSYDPTTKSVQDIVNYFEKGQLKLDPPFQRQSVWSLRDRARLIDSIVNHFPVPSIYLYERKEGGQIVYDVIDGKQRLESILMFMGKLRGWGRFEANVLWPGKQAREVVDWRRLVRSSREDELLSYRIPTHILRGGGPAEVIELFVRINSTGKALTPAERRHALYHGSAFLKAATTLAERFKPMLLANHIISEGQVSRMKHIELACELMLASHSGHPQNKKAAIDGVMDSKNKFTDRQVKVARERTVTAINRTLKLFPNIRETRFRQLSDFYSLVVLVHKFETEKLVLTERRRNQLAADLLTAFAAGVDDLRQRARSFSGARQDEAVFRDYARTVAEGTDALAQRKAREAILRSLLEPLFERKDERRAFTPEQRRVLWNTTAEKRCTECGVKLTWEDFTIDHIDPYSKGGRTNLDNAALMCRQHNSAKGNRRRRAA
ncbi:MAG: HNH endonuclease family protein [Gemmatimonadaceae bacterium]